MRAPFLVPLLLLGLATAIAAGEPEPMSAADAYALPQPDPGLRVRYGDEPRQFGELRLPAGSGPFPVAVVIHGGCWLADYDGAYMGAFAEAVTALGFATWSVGYRRVGEAGGGWPNTFRDVGDAADHLRILAEHHPLDLSRVLAVGHSAGGHLALWLAGRDSIGTASPLYDDDPLAIGGVLGLAAAADLVLLSERGDCENAATRLMAGGPDTVPARYADGSPLTRPAKIPQILVNGALDEQWSAPADRYLNAAAAAGVPVQSRIAPASGHFEPVVPGSVGWPTTRRALTDLLARVDAAKREPAAP
jgi:acetyl esterase/lipase